MSFFKRRSKYGAKRTNGFPSKLENAVHEMLLMRQLAGEIKDIKQQQTVVLQPGGKDVRIAWKVDFSFTKVATGETVFAEAKGFPTNDYLLKLKLWRAKPQFDLEIWTGDYRRPTLKEIIKKWD